MTQPNLITVSEQCSESIEASSLEAYVTISGQSFFTGNQVFKKAKEVVEFVSKMADIGIPESDIQLQDISADVESGFLSKSSSATYELKVHCASIDLIGSVVSEVASSKNCSLSRTKWNFDQEGSVKQKLLRKTVELSKQLAVQISNSLGVKLVGVHKLRYDTYGLDNQNHRGNLVGHISKTAMKARSVDAFTGWNLNHKAEITVSVSAEFLVDTFESNSP